MTRERPRAGRGRAAPAAARPPRRGWRAALDAGPSDARHPLPPAHQRASRTPPSARRFDSRAARAPRDMRARSTRRRSPQSPLSLRPRRDQLDCVTSRRRVTRRCERARRARASSRSALALRAVAAVGTAIEERSLIVRTRPAVSRARSPIRRTIGARNASSSRLRRRSKSTDDARDKRSRSRSISRRHSRRFLIGRSATMRASIVSQMNAPALIRRRLRCSADETRPLGRPLRGAVHARPLRVPGPGLMGAPLRRNSARLGRGRRQRERPESRTRRGSIAAPSKIASPSRLMS